MEFSAFSFATQIAILLVALAAVHRPLGAYLAMAADDDGRHLRAERWLYRVAGVGPDSSQTWKAYARGVIALSVAGVLLLYVAQRVQPLLSGGQVHGVDPWVAMNTAISFVTNTNWQAYTPETTLGFVIQMAFLAVQNFVSAAVGIAVAFALVRGLVRRGTDSLGNLWVDVTRVAFRVLLPLSAIAALVLIVAGVIQDFSPTTVTNSLTGVSQTIPGGPVASQEAIKLLGTNGGGYFNANSAHPFENPNAFTNLFEVFLLLLVPSALPFTFGRMVGDAKQGYTVLTVMGALWALSTGFMAWALAAWPGRGLGLGEGLEQRFGPAASGIFATATTLTSTGAVDAAHDSLPPLAGGMAMANMMLGEIAPGGVGSGLYGMLVLAILAVFLGGLMVGRTPEYLGKKVQARHMTLAALYLLVTPVLVLVLAGAAVLVPAAVAQAPAQGPHQFSELLYAFTSAANNNGSAFAGITTSDPVLSTLLGIAMWMGRVLPIVLVLALAGSFAAQEPIPPSKGTLPTYGPLFAGLLGTVALLFTALNYFPALALGPIAEGTLR
ncbi:potassium-transporting ATPase potassium-binding subunit [Sinomonas cyclohexanicum]|uniref:Potassium-transporting ATPase potassium-binding subunit n=1 Tax=Sinomonas cyclohexanicum TaxID=322009 RepID=A0ABM7Q008_SINCY|nr:potassium-transporting ATPase subunit KdpA [Corynebacterium cyclohexanicum]BCT77900.1 potassium-transporting ATPase potassium-binding subunit [Corynebacterium cyclohexanicum]